MYPNTPGKSSASGEAVVDDDIIDRVQTACTSILRLIILFKERGLLQDKFMLIVRGLARKLLEQTPATPQRSPIVPPHLSNRETAGCPVHSPARQPAPVITEAFGSPPMAPSPPPPARRLIAYQPNVSSGDDVLNWGGGNQANRSYSPGRQCVPVVTPARSYSASNLQQCEFHPIPQSEHRGVSPEELYNSDCLDQLAHVSDPGSFAEFRPDFMSSRVLEDSNEANLPKRCRKHEIMARLRHHH